MNVLINSIVGTLSQCIYIYTYQNIQLYTLHYNLFVYYTPIKLGKKAPAQGPSRSRHSREVWLLKLEGLSQEVLP